MKRSSFSLFAKHPSEMGSAGAPALQTLHKSSAPIPTPEREVKSSLPMIYHCYNRGCAPLCLLISYRSIFVGRASQSITGGGRSVKKFIPFFTSSRYRTGTVPDNANQHLSELQIRPTSNSSKSTTTTQKLKSFCKRLYLMAA